MDQYSVRDELDELDIQRVLYDYAWACDNGDWGLLKSVFTVDAHLDYASTQGPAGSRDEVVAWLEQSLSPVSLIQHVVSNLQIHLHGDRADVTAMSTALYDSREWTTCWSLAATTRKNSFEPLMDGKFNGLWKTTGGCRDPMSGRTSGADRMTQRASKTAASFVTSTTTGPEDMP
jgi:hypothetical protein